MAREHLTADDLYRLDRGETREKVRAKLAEIDTAVDALEGGTTSSVVTIHPADSMALANVANLNAFPVSNDGLTLTAGKRVFLPFQTTASQNGIYVLGTVGSGVAPLTRAADFNEAAEVKPNTFVAVSGGTDGGNTLWQLTVAAAPTIGSTNLPFVQITNKTQLAAYLALVTAAGLIGSDAAGFTATTVKGQLAEVKALADAAIALQKRELRIQHGDLTDAVNGEAQDINLGDALPANAIVLASEVNIATLFSGGDASAVKLDIGGTTATAITNQADVFTGAATGKLSLETGAHPRGHFSGEQLKAKFTPDAGHTLAGLTAGDLTITVWFSVLA